MVDDPQYQAEAETIAGEFAHSDWEGLSPEADTTCLLP